MVYSAIETTCFSLYWPSSGFYNIKEESIKGVKNCEGVLIKRSLHQSPDPSVPSARAICKRGEIYKQRKIRSAVWRWGYSSWGCLKVYAAPRRIPSSPHRRADFSLFINMFTNSSCTRNRVVRRLM